MGVPVPRMKPANHGASNVEDADWEGLGRTPTAGEPRSLLLPWRGNTECASVCTYLYIGGLSTRAFHSLCTGVVGANVGG